MQAPKMSTTPLAARAAGARAIRFGKPRTVKTWARGEEPPVSEILDDPVLHRLMARDNVKPEHLRSLISEMRSRLLER